MSNVNRKDEIQGQIVHEYDGIEEADNDLPRWWLLIFFGTVVFAVVYWFVYEEFNMALQPKEAYMAALAARAEEGGEVSEGLLLAMVEDRGALAQGGEIWTTHCVACHLEQGQGNIGPNLTDRYWIHGGSPLDIHRTIQQGIEGKGMQAWAPVLGEAGVQKVTAYVLTMRNKNLPGKEPQGEVWDPNAEDAPADAPEALGAAGTAEDTGQAAVEADAAGDDSEEVGTEPGAAPGAVDGQPEPVSAREVAAEATEAAQAGERSLPENRPGTGAVPPQKTPPSPAMQAEPASATARGAADAAN